MTGAPVISSCMTASLTESRFSDVVDSAMITGLKAETSSLVFLAGRRDHVVRRNRSASSAA